MNVKKLNHIGLAGAGRHWPSLTEEKRIPQKFHGHFMIQHLDSTKAFNHHESLSGPYQHVGTSNITTVNLIGSRIELGRDNSDLGRWPWK